MRAAELVTASVLIFLGGIVLFDAVRIGVGWGPDGPRSGFFPFWLALIMVIVCGVILVQAALDHRGKSFVSREQLNSVLKVLWPDCGSRADAFRRPLRRFRALHGLLYAMGRPSLVG